MTITGRWRPRGATALALALALFVAACGEEKEPATTGGSTGETATADCGKVVVNEQAWAG